MKKRRRKNPASAQRVFCYTGSEIKAYLNSKLPPEKRSRIYHHLAVEKCRQCNGLYDSLKMAQPGPAEKSLVPEFARIYAERLKQQPEILQLKPVTNKLAAGQIWTTKLNPRNAGGDEVCSVPFGRAVLIIWPNTGDKQLLNIIRVLPISKDTEFQWPGESLVLDPANPLKNPDPALFEIFNEQPMLAGNLDEYLGAVSETDFKKILAVRDAFWDGETKKPDKDYLQWKSKEIELTRYLSAPVNESLWTDEETYEKKPAIPVYPYRKAAATEPIELEDVHPYEILTAKDFRVLTVQINDRVFLRFSSDSLQPENLRIDGKRKKWQKTQISGVYEARLFSSVDIPSSLEISFTANGEQYELSPQFESKIAE